MSRMHSSFFTLWSLLASTATTYVIDTDSCNSAARSFLNDKLGCGFSMVSVAVNELTAGAVQQDVQDLMDNLWTPSTTAAVPSPQEAIECRFHGVCPVNKQLGNYFTYYPLAGGRAQWPRGILSMQDQAIDVRRPGGATATGGDDVIFYCGTSRYKDIKDQDGNPQIKDTSIIEYDDPRTTEDPRKMCIGALAFTTVSDDETKPSQITICPWFLSYAQGLKFPNCGTWSQKLVGLLGRPIAVLSSRKWPYTPVDLFSLFDKVMVHELTHTRHGGQTVDVKIDPSQGDSGTAMLKNVAYGWTNVRSIAGRTPDTVPSRNDNPMNNADAYGLFASGVRILRAGGTISSDGKVSGVSRSSVSKLALTPEEKEELGSLAIMFEEPDSGEALDMSLWSPAFNATMFPETTNLSEKQKRMVVDALTDQLHREHRH